MEALECSVEKLSGAICQKLGTLSDQPTTKQVKDVHSFVKEASGLLQTILSLGEPEEPDILEEMACITGEIEDQDEEQGEIFYHTFLQSCDLIADMYRLLDDNKIKEFNSEWIFEEAKIFMETARELFGSRVPELPTMRLVSKPKKETKAKPKATKKAKAK